MNEEQFQEHLQRRNDSMLELVWPEVERRLKAGQAPIQIASEMAKEGYCGFGSNRLGIEDIHRLQELAIKSHRTGSLSLDECN